VDHIGQHVQSASVGHAYNHLLNPVLNQGIEDLFEAWDEPFAAFKAEPFQCVEFVGEE